MILALALAGCGSPTPEGPAPGSAEALGLDPALVDAGRRLFREGLSVTGQPVKAIVLGDVPLDATRASCVSCHGRSGMGTQEQDNRTPPIAGALLFEDDAQEKRPAYDDYTLARALREGVAPGGRKLDPLMPRYPLTPDDTRALSAYLKTLGAVPSPGADDNEVRVVTVIAGDVPDADRQNMLAVLERFVETKNAEARNEQERAYARREKGRAFKPYRVWTFDVWELTGEPRTWKAQAQALYDDKPPFAMISGLAAGPWEPLHRFCEDNEMPCLFPLTEWVPEPSTDFYTMYYSGGLRLEAEIMAADLKKQGLGGNVVQFVPSGDDAARAAADVLTAEVTADGGSAKAEVGTPTASGLQSGASAVVVWHTDATVLPATAGGSAPLYLSATRLGGAWDAVPEGLRARTRVVNLYRSGSDPGVHRFELWARSRKVDVRDTALQAKTWFACIALVDGMKHISRYAHRDYLLDTLDHAAGLSVFVPRYPRATLGPGQRWAAKGGAVVDASGAQEARWIVP